MKNFFLFICMFFMYSSNIVAQEKNKRLSFVLVIDGEVLNANTNTTASLSSLLSTSSTSAAAASFYG